MTDGIKEMDKIMKCPQTPTDYMVVRVQLVHVTIGYLQTKDEFVGYRAVIEPTAESAVKLASRVMSYIDSEKTSTETVRVK